MPPSNREYEQHLGNSTVTHIVGAAPHDIQHIYNLGTDCTYNRVYQVYFLRFPCTGRCAFRFLGLYRL